MILAQQALPDINQRFTTFLDEAAKYGYSTASLHGSNATRLGLDIDHVLPIDQLLRLISLALDVSGVIIPLCDPAANVMPDSFKVNMKTRQIELTTP